jgi:hypothetical protein
VLSRVTVTCAVALPKALLAVATTVFAPSLTGTVAA